MKIKIRAKRFFISAAFGNVPAEKILEASKAQAENLIACGLAEEVKTATNEEAQKMIDRGEAKVPKEAIIKDGDPDPIQPTAEKTPGASSQAAPASQKKTARKSARGKGKAKKGKSRS